MNFETDILAGVVGIATAIMLFLQIREQSKFSQRIADLEYIKLMEPKLLAVVYDPDNIVAHTKQISSNEHPNSLPPFDWYKFQFLIGRIPAGGYGFVSLNKWHKTPESKEKYIKTYEETMKHIKTEDLRNAFKTSRWAEFYELCKNQ